MQSMDDSDAASGVEQRIVPPKKPSRLRFLLALIIPAMVILPLWFFFIGPKMRHDRLVDHGVHVSGTLLGVEETGTYVNDSPELELTIQLRRADGTLDTGKTDFVPSLRTLHMYQEGATVMVAYDSTDPDEMTVVSFGGPGTAAGATPASPGASADSLRRAIDSMRTVADSLARATKR